MPSSLVSRNVTVAGHRTSVRLEPVMWQALKEISNRERITLYDFCARAQAGHPRSTLTAAIRAGVVDYLLDALAASEARLAALEKGQEPV